MCIGRGAVNLLTIASGMHNTACIAFHTSNGSLPEPTQRLALKSYACLQEHQQADEDEEHMADTSVSAVSSLHQPVSQGVPVADDWPHGHRPMRLYCARR